MPNVFSMLTEHIRRQSRREIRKQMARSKRLSAKLRHDNAAMKRLVRALGSRVAYLEKRSSRGPAVAPVENTEKMRFRVDGLRSHRARLGISAEDFGKLVGVSRLTVYNWESGKSKPRRKQLAALAGVRGMGKREALKQLGRS